MSYHINKIDTSIDENKKDTNYSLNKKDTNDDTHNEMNLDDENNNETYYKINGNKRLKKERITCFFCGKHKKNKKSLLLYDCRCNNQYCAEHLIPEIHNCIFDYKTNHKEKIKIDNPKIEHLKINKI